MDEQIFQARLRALRKERHGTQEAFAFRSGVSRATVQNWESGRHVPSLSDAVLIADQLGVSLDYLAGRTDSDVREAVEDAATALADSLVADGSPPPQPVPIERRRGSRRATDLPPRAAS